MIKKSLLFVALVMMVTFSGCSLKIQRDVFYLPQDEVDSVVIQREYTGEDGLYYMEKKVSDQKDVEEICELVRKLPVRRASSEEPHPITKFSLIIVIKGEKTHHLILTEELAFYDQIAYEYTDKDTYRDFVKLYTNLNYAEEQAEADRF